MSGSAARAVLGDFRVEAPAYRGAQDSALQWLAEAHAQAELALRGPAATAQGAAEREALAARVRRGVLRLASANDRIRWRGSVLEDFAHTDWDKMEIFPLQLQPAGVPSSARSELYARVVGEVFERFYAGEQQPPAVLMHVTCTGYVAPSGAQRLVARRGWGSCTEVIHVYHMGCYAALPGIRLAAALAASGKPRVDLVHTELCTLHLDPTRHSVEQLMVQSLFADGLVRYSVCAPAARLPGPGLELLAGYEEILPDSEADMSWSVGEHGMRMSISRGVPQRLAAALAPCLERLAQAAGVPPGVLREALFAVHPGGPRIVDQVRDALGLDAAQVAHSDAVLAEHGNMSSATLPHIWKALLEDPAVPVGTAVVALAFGPGLTLSSALLRKAAAA